VINQTLQGQHMKAAITALVVGLLVLVGVSPAAQAAPSLSIGVVPYENAFSARARSFGNTPGSELYVGVGDLGVPTNRTEQNISWILGDNPFTFAFDGTRLLSLSAGSGSATYTLDSAQRAAGIDLIVLTLLDRTSNGDIFLNNLAIDTGLGAVALTNTPLLGLGGSGLQAYISGADLSRGFVLTGVLRLTGVFGAFTPTAAFGTSQEASRLDLYAGRSGAQVVGEPATLALFGLGLIALGVFAKRKAF
jgi:hypothetical protein